MKKIKQSEMAEIQIWNTYRQIICNKDKVKGKFQVTVDMNPPPLSDLIKNKVKKHWDEQVKENPRMTINPILFLTDPIEIDEEKNNIRIKTNVRGFDKTHAYNRNPKFQRYTGELRNNSLLSISTHGHLITNDDKVIFGTKKNQFNQISGFSGFPNVKEDTVTIDGKTYLDVCKTIENRLRPEIGDIVDHIETIEAVGVTYVNRPGLRGLDSNFAFYLDISADKAKELFSESFQFTKKLYAVDFNPDSLAEFYTQIFREGKQMSPYALGCSVAIANANFGDEGSRQIMDAIESVGLTVSRGNETTYFRDKA